MDRQLLSWRLCISQCSSKGKNFRSTLRQRIYEITLRSVLRSPEQLRYRSWYVERDKYKPLSKKRDQEDCYSAQRQGQATCQPTGPPEIEEPSGRNRAADSSSENTWARTKSNENRYWRPYFRIPIRLGVQLVLSLRRQNYPEGP